jgi:hypothetical protein
MGKDFFGKRSVGLESPGTKHYMIIPGTDPAMRPRCLRIGGDGLIVVEDERGEQIEYPVFAGEVFKFRADKVISANPPDLHIVGWC